MYDIDKISYGIRNPRRVLWELGWIYHRRVRGKRGIHIMDADWDNLVILDACRYDLFEEVNTLPGNLSEVISRGSSTAEFLHRNFKQDDQTYNDTVYVSGNPQTRNHGVEGLFHDSVPVWEQRWNDDLQTVHPEGLTEESIRLSDQYPNKRLIIHYIQPHYPFIGETGRKIEHRSVHGGGVKTDRDSVADSVWQRLEDGELSQDRVWKAYRENLELTLPHIETLLIELHGKTIITSDHGNAMGRWGLYGHPTKRYHQGLVSVPWLEAPYDGRKDIEEEQLNEPDPEQDGSPVGDRLKHLGYK